MPQRLTFTSETEFGWEIIGQADVYIILLGEQDWAKRRLKVNRAKSGVLLYSALRFEYVKDASGPGGIKLSSAMIFSDSLPTLSLLLKRGVLNSQDLLQ